MSRVLVPLAQGCEELEAVTITDLLTRAGIEVITAGLDDRPVKASRGITLLPDTTIKQVLNDSFDMVVLPGGLPGANHLRDDARIQTLLKQQAASNKPVAAVCAAPKALASAGLLEGKTVTCYPGSLNDSGLTNTTITSSAIQIDGNIITSRGPGTAMDFALILIELLAGKEKRDEINQQLVR
ncbi:MAG: DJ-1/PfpI family protein [Gammaproteobacteria bacterium]|nr:DJ-1/PfpI family protein [Gammaproteobacteria bacterium]